jgi:hypothetical protein
MIRKMVMDSSLGQMVGVIKDNGKMENKMVGEYSIQDKVLRR